MIRLSMSRFLFLLGIGFTILTPILIMNVVNSSVHQEDEVVATQVIPPYTKVTNEMVEIKKVPHGGVPDDAIQDLNQVIGKYTRTSVGQGHIFQKDHLANVALGDSQAINVTDKKDPYLRGFLLPMSLFQSKKAFAVGDKVDLISIVTSQDRERGSVGKIIASGVPILAINLPENGYESGTVMVGVDPVLATKLAYILKSASLYVSLWPYDGKVPKQLPEVDMSSFDNHAWGSRPPGVQKGGSN